MSTTFDNSATDSSFEEEYSDIEEENTINAIASDSVNTKVDMSVQETQVTYDITKLGDMLASSIFYMQNKKSLSGSTVGLCDFFYGKASLFELLIAILSRFERYGGLCTNYNKNAEGKHKFVNKLSAAREFKVYQLLSSGKVLEKKNGLVETLRSFRSIIETWSAVHEEFRFASLLTQRPKAQDAYPAAGRGYKEMQKVAFKDIVNTFLHRFEYVINEANKRKANIDGLGNFKTMLNTYFNYFLDMWEVIDNAFKIAQHEQDLMTKTSTKPTFIVQVVPEQYANLLEKGFYPKGTLASGKKETPVYQKRTAVAKYAS